MPRNVPLPSASVIRSQNPQLIDKGPAPTTADEEDITQSEEEEDDDDSSSSSDVMFPSSVLDCIRIDNINDKYDGRTSKIINSYFARNVEFLNRKYKHLVRSQVDNRKRNAASSFGSVLEQLKILPCSCVTLLQSQESFLSASNGSSGSSTTVTPSSSDIAVSPSPSKQASALAAIQRNKNFQLLKSLTDKAQDSGGVLADKNTIQKKIATLDGKKRICLFGCRYDVLPVVATEAGFELVGENELWNINWSDCPLPQEKICQMRRIQDTYSVFWGVSAPLQKTNHFPGMYEICRKDRLGRNLNRLRRLFSVDYSFFPETWDLPTEQADLLNYAKRRKNITFIIKPESGCQGKGIFLLRNLKKLSPFTKCVCQVYVPNPFLIDGYKFDQRIYVLITCVDPLRVYIYQEGIARFATVKYEPPTDENLEVVFMHLTNYSLNKFSESYVREGGDGSKRKTSAIYRWMTENGHDVPKLIRAIDEVIVKTLLCAAPTLRHNYKTCFPKRDRGSSCFEILGFDILIDKQLNPILLEVNHSPSFNLDLPVDGEVKKQLLRDMFNMVYLGDELNAARRNREARRNAGKLRVNGGAPNQPPIKEKPRIRSPPSPVKESKPPAPEILPKFLVSQFKHEIKNKGNFRLIYSSEKPGKYTKLVDETYVGFPSSSVNTTSLLEQILDHQQGKKGGKFNRNMIFESGLDDRQEQNPNPALKTTKHGQSYMDTRLTPSDPICSSINGQRGFRMVQPLPRSELALTRRNVFGSRSKKMQEFAYLQKRSKNGVKVLNNSNISYTNAYKDDEIDLSKYSYKKDKGKGAGGGGISNVKFQFVTDNKNNNKK